MSDQLRTHSNLGFVTYLRKEGVEQGKYELLLSRRCRKGLSNLEFAKDTYIEKSAIGKPGYKNPWLRFWSPDLLSWRIAIHFMIGSLCFAVASFAANWPQQLPSYVTQGETIGWIFFIGSLFFTLAAWIQLVEAINGDIQDALNKSSTWRWFSWKPHNAGYMASLIQLIGTILFNINTAAGLIPNLTGKELDLYNWTPDVLGSACFLVASQLAMMEVTHKIWDFQPKILSWWITFINQLGCVAFAIAAAFTFFDLDTGNMWWAWGANTYTLIGAICFFIGSYLLIPEIFDATEKQNAAHIQQLDLVTYSESNG